MTAVRALAARLQGFTAEGFLPGRESGVQALKLESASEILILLWRISTEDYQTRVLRDTVTVAFGARPSGAWDMLGKPMTLPPPSGGKTVFPAGPDPIYVTFPKAGVSLRSAPSRKTLPSSALQGASGSFWWDLIGRLRRH